MLEHGSIPLHPETLVVDCSASRYQNDRQCLCGAAFIAHLEACSLDDGEKNALCTPVPPPDRDIDWLRMAIVQRFQQAAPAAVAKLQGLLATVA